METTARIGWIGRAVLYLLVAALVARLPSTGTGRKVDKEGAFAVLADSPYGGWLLAAITAALASFAVYRGWAAIRGDDEKTTRRIGWAVSTVVYAGLAVGSLGFLLGGGGGGNEEKTLTARVLGWPGGQVIVGAAGIVAIGVAANYVRKGVKEGFWRDIEEGAVPSGLLPVVRVLGIAGWLGRALVWALVGWFLLRVAVQHDASEPVGLDESLRRLAAESWGPAVLWVAFAGLLAYGLVCLATAAWPDAEPDERDQPDRAESNVARWSTS